MKKSKKIFLSNILRYIKYRAYNSKIELQQIKQSINGIEGYRLTVSGQPILFAALETLHSFQLFLINESNINNRKINKLKNKVKDIEKDWISFKTSIKEIDKDARNGAIKGKCIFEISNPHLSK